MPKIKACMLGKIFMLCFFKCQKRKHFFIWVFSQTHGVYPRLNALCSVKIVMLFCCSNLRCFGGYIHFRQQMWVHSMARNPSKCRQPYTGQHRIRASHWQLTRIPSSNRLVRPVLGPNWVQLRRIRVHFLLHRRLWLRPSRMQRRWSRPPATLAEFTLGTIRMIYEILVACSLFGVLWQWLN